MCGRIFDWDDRVSKLSLDNVAITIPSVMMPSPCGEVDVAAELMAPVIALSSSPGWTWPSFCEYRIPVNWRMEACATGSLSLELVNIAESICFGSPSRTTGLDR
jgi:hypothetical protein